MNGKILPSMVTQSHLELSDLEKKRSLYVIRERTLETTKGGWFSKENYGHERCFGDSNEDLTQGYEQLHKEAIQL